VIRLAFLSPSGAAADVAVTSPLLHSASSGIADVSHLGKLELRGPLDRVEPEPGEELIRLRSDRGLLVTDSSPAAALERLAGAGVRAYDVTAALAAFEVSGLDAFRRLTEFDPRELPAVGSIARGTTAIIVDRGGATFRIFVAQELGHYVAEVVLDVLKGLGR